MGLSLFFRFECLSFGVKGFGIRFLGIEDFRAS